MRYCKKCHILYSSEAAACPKCGCDAEAAKRSETADEKAPESDVKRDWLWLIIGIPLLIGLIYLFVYIFKMI